MDTLLDRALRPRGQCLGLFLRCPHVEKSCERLADLKPRAFEHFGEPNWRRQDLLAMRLRLSSHGTMADRASQALDMQTLPFSTVGEKAAAEMAGKEGEGRAQERLPKLST